MKWLAIKALLVFGASVVSAQEETVSHLRRENETTNARRKIFSIFTERDGYRAHHVKYRGGYRKIDDRGTRHCSKKEPCGECQGDCDYDSDCKKGLYCYHRKPYKSVPGCSGGSKAKSKTDFCVKGKKSDSHSSKSDSHSSKSASHSSKSDSHSSKSNSHSSPSKDAGGKIKDKGTDYCTKREPCGECYGDCDSDKECKSGLYCYKRKEYESVPGCSGGSKAKSKTDFCVKKKHHKPSSSTPTKKKPSSTSHTKKKPSYTSHTKKKHSSPSHKKKRYYKRYGYYDD